MTDDFVGLLNFVQNHFTVSCLALLLYEYIITLSDEVQFVWLYDRGPRRFRLSKVSVLLLLNRYLPLLAYIPFICINLWYMPPVDAKTFSTFMKVMWVSQVFAILSLAVYSTLLVVRTYALMEGRRWIMAIAIPLALSATIFPVLSFIIDHSHALDNLDYGSAVFQFSLAVNMASWPAIGVFEIFVFIVTLVKTIPMRNRARQFGMHTTLTDLLVRDGSMYLMTLIASNVFGVVIAVTWSPLNNINLDTGIGITPLLNNIFGAILTSRLMLNLRADACKSLDDQNNTTRDGYNDGMISTFIAGERTRAGEIC